MQVMQPGGCGSAGLGLVGPAVSVGLGFGVRFSQAESQVLPLGHNSPMGHSRHREFGLESWERT